MEVNPPTTSGWRVEERAIPMEIDKFIDQVRAASNERLMLECLYRLLSVAPCAREDTAYKEIMVNEIFKRYEASK